MLVGKLPLRVDILLIRRQAGERSLGEEFVMQHADTEYMGELEEELQTAVLEAIPVERRLRGMPAEERLRGLSPEEVASAFHPGASRGWAE